MTTNGMNEADLACAPLLRAPLGSTGFTRSMKGGADRIPYFPGKVVLTMGSTLGVHLKHHFCFYIHAHNDQDHSR